MARRIPGTWKHYWPFYLLITAFWIVYVALSFAVTPAPSPLTAHLTPFALAAIRFSVILPFLALWLILLYGIARLNTYVRTIKDSPDGQALGRIRTSLFFFLAASIITTLVGGVKAFFRYPDVTGIGLGMVNTYLQVIIPLHGFVFAYLGSKNLLAVMPQKKIGFWPRIAVILGVLLYSLLYLWLIFTNPTRYQSTNPAVAPTYFLPDPLIIITVALPAVIGWLFGAWSVLNISHYARTVAGAIYRSALNYFALGLGGIITASILIQFLVSLGGQRLLSFGLGPLLGVIYFFLLLQGLGYLFVAVGSRKLTEIESV